MLGALWSAFTSAQDAAATNQRVAASNKSGSPVESPTSDQRQLVKVSKPVRLLSLQNMADVMANVASILDGLASNDRYVVAKAAPTGKLRILIRGLLIGDPIILRWRALLSAGRVAPLSRKTWRHIDRQARLLPDVRPLLGEECLD